MFAAWALSKIVTNVIKNVSFGPIPLRGLTLSKRPMSKCPGECPPDRTCTKEKHPDSKQTINPQNDVEIPSTRACGATNPCRVSNSSSCRPKEPYCPKAEECECPDLQEDPCEMVTGCHLSTPINMACCKNPALSKSPCAKTFKKGELKQQNEPFKSMWTYPKECCRNPCPEMLPRFDELYWCPSDKYKRKYQQTWVECPRIKVRPRKVCCFDEAGLPPICRRERQVCPETACAFDATKLKTLCCAQGSGKCPRVSMPCCRGARIPPRCVPTKIRTPCKIFCCPYPSYSECCKPCPKPKHPVECKCADSSPLCVVYQFLRRKKQYNLPPPLPAWPPQMIGAKYHP